MEQPSTEAHAHKGAALIRQWEETGATEIAICGGGAAFHRRARNAWTPASGPLLKRADIIEAIEGVASSAGAWFDENNAPWVHAMTPEGHRACGIAGRGLAQDDTGLYIRSAAHSNDVGEGEDAMQRALREARANPAMPHDIGAALEVAEKAQCLIIAGPTNAGKTTLLNELLRHAGEHTRVITVEETRELELTRQNRLQLTARRSNSANTQGFTPDTAEAWQIAVRSGPDIVVFGEVSIENAMFVRQMLAPSAVRMWTTMHAASAHEVADTIWTLTRQGEPDLTREEVEHAVRTTCGIIRIGTSERRIKEIVLPG